MSGRRVKHESFHLSRAYRNRGASGGNPERAQRNEGGEEMTMVEIVELLKKILEVLDKLYHATIGEEEQTDDKVC